MAICQICDGQNGSNTENKTKGKKQTFRTQFHEPGGDRDFRVVFRSGEDVVEFFVDPQFMSRLSSFFRDQINSNSPTEVEDVRPSDFHTFLEAVCPTLYGIRPVPITVSTVTSLIDMSNRFKCDSLLTACERFLIGLDNSSLTGSLLLSLINVSMKSCIDHQVLCRILCLCITETPRLANSSHEVNGPLGSFLAQALIANSSKQFRHVRPVKRESPNPVIQKLFSDNSPKRKGACDHSRKSFKCILCFQSVCKSCKGQAAFCFKALDNFVYEARDQLWPDTYQRHLDRDLLREDAIDAYILRNQILPSQP
ncbi:unnamed protein product [Caenorhabditis auriculariae]|uniref:BTB domain-containing protein n=1 Tax=Caenorhabditis auriculariae TaxID=2777116 RepID=A0A8S1HP26_9PELO|nr:unnamed protein product [Caenorhabditis auriculariae]